MAKKREKRHYRKVDLSNLRRESYEELTPGKSRVSPDLVNTYRFLNQDYLRLVDETGAALVRLIRYEDDHPGLLSKPR